MPAFFSLTFVDSRKIILAKFLTFWRFAKIYTREIFKSLSFAKISTREIRFFLTRENKYTRKLVRLRYNIKSLDKYRKGKSNVDIGAWVS